MLPNNIFIALALALHQSPSRQDHVCLWANHHHHHRQTTRGSSSTSLLHMINYKPFSTRSRRCRNFRLKRKKQKSKPTYIVKVYIYKCTTIINILLPLALTVHLDKTTFVNGQIIFIIFIKRFLLIFNKFIIFIRETCRIKNFSFFERFLPFLSLFDYRSIRNSSRRTEV